MPFQQSTSSHFAIRLMRRKIQTIFGQPQKKDRAKETSNPLMKNNEKRKKEISFVFLLFCTRRKMSNARVIGSWNDFPTEKLCPIKRNF